MNRKEFLEKLGIGAAFALTATCLGACSSDTSGSNSGGTTGNSVDFTLDLAAASNANLLKKGGYVISNGVVVAQTLAGNYVAAINLCSHENLKKVIYRSDEFYCTEHGARFNQAGVGLNSEGQRGIKVYKTTLTGNQLRITG